MNLQSRKIEVPESSEFLPSIGNKITQARPRRILKFSVLFTFIALCLSLVCLGVLLIFIYPMWWMLLIGGLFSIPPFFFSLCASRNGKCACIGAVSASCLFSVSIAIGVVCVVMTGMSDAVSIHDACGVSPSTSAAMATGIRCDSYSKSTLEYFEFVSSHRALLVALVTVYAATCIVLDGVTMAYTFFLARRCLSHAPNWLVSKMGNKRYITNPSYRSTSGSTISITQPPAAVVSV